MGNLEHIKSIIHYDPSEREIGLSYLNAIENDRKEVVDYFLNNYPETMYWFRNSDNVWAKRLHGPSYALHLSHYQLAYYMVNNYRDFIELDESLEKLTIVALRSKCNVAPSDDVFEEEGMIERYWSGVVGEAIFYGEGSDECDSLYDIIFLIDNPSSTVASLKETAWFTS